MADEWLDDFVTDLVTQLEERTKTAAPDDRGLIYSAARLLRAYNELFAMTWTDVAMAEERIREREVVA